VACSGVAMASQSETYVASNTGTIANKIGFANRIKMKLIVLRDCVKQVFRFAAGRRRYEGG